MDIQESLQVACVAAERYSELVARLLEIGIQSYTVDVATGIVFYRLADGAHILHYPETANRTIAPYFGREATIQAVRDSRQKKIDYPGFMDAVAAAGVYLYRSYHGPKG